MAIQDTSSQSNRQHAVPQNIMDVEFKIIGDLTMRQFSYLLILGLLAYFNMQVMVGIFKWPLTLFFGILGMALAFIPVQDRGMDVWLVNFIKSVYSPTQLVWRKAAIVPSAFLYDSLEMVRQELITLAPTSSRRKLEEFLDYSKKHQPIDPLDIPEEEYIKKVHQMSQQFKAGASQVTPYNPARAATPVSMNLVLPTEQPVAKTVPTPPVQQIQQKPEDRHEDTPPQGKPAEKTTFLDRLDKITASLSSHTQESVAEKVEKPSESSVKPATSEEKVSTVREQAALSASRAPAPTTTLASAEPTSSKSVDEKPVQLNVVPSVQQQRPVVEVTPLKFPGTSAQASPDISSTAMTPDRHSGRRFTSFLPAQGEIVLPIRGERVLKTSEQENLEGDLEVKTQRLNQLLDQIRQSNIKPAKKTSSANAVSNVPIVASETTKEAPDKNKSTDSRSNGRPTRSGGFNSMKSFFSSSSAPATITVDGPSKSAPQVSETVIQRSNISKNSPKIVAPLPHVSNDSKEKQLELANATLMQLTKKRSSILSELGTLRNSADPTNSGKIDDLQKSLQKINNEYQVLKQQVQDIRTLLKGARQPSSGSTGNVRDASEVIAPNTPVLNKPNILWGFVKDPLGKSITDTVVIIKNSRGEPVRATKTNELGQFLLTTPLSNGNYTAEVSTTHKTGLEFDTISLEASGSVIPPVEFLGR